MILSDDIHRCEGKGCAIRTSCARFTQGCADRNNGDNASPWFTHCDEEKRNGYIKND